MLSGFELYPRWVPLYNWTTNNEAKHDLLRLRQRQRSLTVDCLTNDLSCNYFTSKSDGYGWLRKKVQHSQPK